MNTYPVLLLVGIRIRVDRVLLDVVGFQGWRGRRCMSELRRLLASLVARIDLLGLCTLVMRQEVGGGGLGGRRRSVRLRDKMRI
jgi:hypothetical protein